MTRIVRADASGIREAARLLKGGEAVAIPTETVYGLAAGVFSAGVEKIFTAKGRPQDNPLIVHVSDTAMVRLAVREVPQAALVLMEAFWPGPLSIILPKHPAVPDVVSAGLETVAVRMPQHPAARAIIAAAGTPLAAPSANTSGRPSPTCAAHVFSDLAGRIPLIVDGGRCAIGVESTVIDLSGDEPVILRPGGITPEQIRRFLPGVRLHSGLLQEGEQPASPGMKYRHYAPAAEVIVFEGPSQNVARKIRQRYHNDQDKQKDPLILCSEENVPLYQDLPVRSLGNGAAAAESALFYELRRADAQHHQILYFHYDELMGLAVRNRICKAAAQNRERIR